MTSGHQRAPRLMARCWGETKEHIYIYIYIYRFVFKEWIENEGQHGLMGVLNLI
jgi:hypothetical protein